MSATRLNFEQWQQLSREAPERVVDQFLGKLELISSVTRRALIASHPDRQRLLSSLRAACSHEEAPLSGVPYILQDLFDVRGLPTACGAPFTAPFVAPLEHSSLLYQKLNTLGACFLGKSVPAEFGVDPYGSNPSAGDCPHADGLRYVCGGGAGASIRAVANGWAPLAFGLDTCGGVRIPAAFHGLFGFRMGTNDFAREGVFPIVPSIESVGWVTAFPEDLLTCFKAFYRLPPTVETRTPYGYLLTDLAGRPLNSSLKAPMMQLLRGLNMDEDPSIRKRLLDAFARARQALSVIEGRELHSIHQYWIEEYRDRYSPPLLQRIEQGQNCTVADAEKSTLIQQWIRASFTEFFVEHDYLVLPISPAPTPEKSIWTPEFEHDLLQLCAPASLAFLPALILPVSCKNGLHGAVQVIVHPRKLHVVPQILAQVTEYYSAGLALGSE